MQKVAEKFQSRYSRHMEIAEIQKYGMDCADAKSQGAMERASQDIEKTVADIDGAAIKNFYLSRGTDKMRSVSAPVNKLLLEGLEGRGWELNWRFIPVQSQQATFEAAKDFSGSGGERIGLDIGSRHAMSALGFFVRGTAASSTEIDARSPCIGSFLLAFTDETISWGLWNKANSSFESLQEEAKIALPLITKPLWLVGINPTRDLEIESRASGTLRLHQL